uniref:Uncharacterized protein n=1 Tax=Kalanchoe fedtschenkoi TaxID=63787 RepID=A0A7N0RA24_KALFE
MLGFTARKLLLLQRRCTVHKAVVLHHHSSKAFLYSTSIESDLKGDAFTVSYLVNSCGVAVNRIICLQKGDSNASVHTFLVRYRRLSPPYAVSPKFEFM